MTSANLRILAIDTSASPGFAVVEAKSLKKGVSLRLLGVDSVKTNAGMTDSQRYAVIEAKTTQMIHEYGAFDVVVRESFIKGGSKRATQLVFGSWAAVDSALGRFGYAIQPENELTPASVKKAATGAGKAEKGEVEAGVRRRFGLGDGFAFKSDDESDAVAIALAYLIREGVIA